MRENPRLKILHVAGLYDLATPFFAAEYDLGHMALEPQIAANIRYTYYPAGHMMYIDPASARQLKADLAGFYAARNRQMKRAGRLLRRPFRPLKGN